MRNKCKFPNGNSITICCIVCFFELYYYLKYNSKGEDDSVISAISLEASQLFCYVNALGNLQLLRILWNHIFLKRLESAVFSIKERIIYVFSVNITLGRC